MSYRFVHAADLHLDTPFWGLGTVSPELQAALRDASLEAWDALVSMTITEAAAFLLLAGDIYDGATRGVRAQLRFLQGLKRLSAAGIQVFIVHGNHDPLEGWSAIRDIRDWPPGVTVYDSTEVHAVSVERDGKVLATVHGISYAERDVRENLALRFTRGPEPGIHVGLLHCSVGSHPGHQAYSPCSIEDLRRAGLDYWALGHVHTRQFLAGGSPWVAYPGNLQGRSAKPSELGKKGALVVEVDGVTIAEPRFVELDRVVFDRVALDVGKVVDLGSLIDELAAAAEAKRAEHGDRGLILRATLEGRGDLHALLRRPDTVPGLLQELRDQRSVSTPFLWWDEIADNTRTALDRGAIRQRDDFAGMLARFGDALLLDPAAREDFAGGCTEALRALLGTRARREFFPEEGEDLADNLDQAVNDALDLLAAATE